MIAFESSMYQVDYIQIFQLFCLDKIPVFKLYTIFWPSVSKNISFLSSFRETWVEVYWVGGKLSTGLCFSLLFTCCYSVFFGACMAAQCLWVQPSLSLLMFVQWLSHPRFCSFKFISLPTRQSHTRQNVWTKKQPSLYAPCFGVCFIVSWFYQSSMFKWVFSL